MRSKSNLVSATAMLVVLGLFGSTLVANVNEGLISHWRFDEGGGRMAYDSAGTNDGTVYGAIWTTGQINGALSFDGVDDYVDVGDPVDESLDFGAGDSFSISAWIRTNMDSPIVYKRRCGGTGGVYYEGYGFQLWSLKLYFGIEDTGGRNAGIFGNTMVADDRWHHVVVVRDLGEDKLYLYADGSSDAAPVHDATTGTLATSRSFHIGRRDSTVSPGYLYCEGKMDDVRIYDRPLSAGEIMELYSTSDSGPIAHWKFDEGSGSIAYDSAGNNHGNIYGATWATGQINGALSFDGVDDYVEVIDSDDSLDIEDNITIATWVKLDYFNLHDHDYFVGKQPTGTSRTNFPGNYIFRTTPSNGYLHFHHQTGTGGYHEISKYSSTYGIVPGEWQHCSVTLVEGGNVNFYIDGSPAGTVPQLGTFGLLNDEPVRIGTRKDEWSYFFGLLDEIFIFNRALSAEEILALYKGIITVGLDIKPGSCPNPLNVKNRGVLPVAILGSEDFDVNTIVATSVRLAGVAPIRDSYEDVATPVSDANECECSAEGPDGFTDLVLKFETQEILEAIGEVDHGDELVLDLTGVLSDETPVEGSDCVIIRGRHKPLNRADFNGDGTVDLTDFAAFAENWLQSSIADY